MECTKNRFGIIAGLLLILGFGALLFPESTHAGRSILTNFSFDDCDPFEAQAIVMDVFPNKGQFIAAEQIIYVVDMPIEDQRLITEISDATGRHLDLGSLRRGQWIHIKGFKHIDGGVVASWVQKIDPPENKRPALRKLVIERPPQQKRIMSAAGVIRQ
jgi:hypothetical protein